MAGRLGGLALAAIVIAGVAWIVAQGPRPAPPITAGVPAPDFALASLDGAEVSLEALRGRVVLLNFWATWCKPCEDEMPAMERLYQALRADGFELLAVSVDDGREEVADFRARLGLSFPILLDPDKRVATRYQAFKFPESVLIDREGVLVSRYIGPREWDAEAYQERIRRLLTESGG